MIDFSIIVPYGSRTAMLRWCIKTIRKNSYNKNHEIIIGFDHVHKAKDMSKPLDTQEEYIEKRHNPPDENLLEFLKKYNCKYYDLGELGDHYRDTNACIQFCLNQWLMFMHNDIYCSRNWDLGLINCIENLIAQGDDILIPNSLPDHAQPAGIQHLYVVEKLGVNFGWEEKEIYRFEEEKVERFIAEHSQPNKFFKELERNKSWVCPIVIKKETFLKVGMYPTKEPFPFGNDLELDRKLTDITHSYKIVPLDSFIWHL